MFVFSLRASRLKLFFAVIICVVIAVIAIMLMPDTQHAVSVNGMQYDKKIKFDGIKTENDVVSFAENLGYSVDAVPTESAEVKIPSKFDAVLEKYNDLQKSQGFNLGKYKNKTVTRYTYRVAALPDSQSLPIEDVLLTLIVYRDKIVGGDLYFSGDSAEVRGFLK